MTLVLQRDVYKICSELFGGVSQKPEKCEDLRCLQGDVVNVRRRQIALRVELESDVITSSTRRSDGAVQLTKKFSYQNWCIYI